MLTRSLSKLMLHSPTTTKLVFMDTEASSGATFQPNHLALIPDEVLSHIISFLSLTDIGMICLTGSSWLSLFMNSIWPHDNFMALTGQRQDKAKQIF